MKGTDSAPGATMERIRNKLSLVPEQPGCYLMKNREGKIIYVGKAKVLRNRLRSYFTGSHDGKTQRLVSEIDDFEVIVTSSDLEALLLECNLIKKHRPRYNVLLKDDKTYPYIKITGEEHPRLEVTRKVLNDNGKYFGPYPSAFAAQQTKRLLDRIVPLRKCKTMPDRVCLYYHIGQCLGPCQFEVGAEENERMVQQVLRFLKGGHEEIRKDLVRRMHEAAEELQFEKAKELRDLIRYLDMTMEKQSITVADAVDRDIFGYAADKGWMCVQILYMRQGKILERHASMFPYYGEEYEDFITFLTQYYSDNPSLPREVLLPSPPQEGLRKSGQEGSGNGENGEATNGSDLQAMLENWLKIKVLFPKRGAKKKLVDMAAENARVALDEKFRLMEKNEERTVKAAENLGNRLGIGPARRIEAFDNSNIQGSDPVSAMVVFINGKPERKEYRKYKIKTVEGPDDVATMREVIRRRYVRVLKENLPLPDLVLVDGGKGQLAAAVDVLENELGLDIPVCGMVKDRRHKTAQLVMGDPPEEIPIERDSQEFYLLQRIQEEVHRFAVEFHRQTRGKSMTSSVLDSIPGIGEKRRKMLLKHFGSVKKLKEASLEELKSLGIGEKLARKMLDALREENPLSSPGTDGTESEK